MPACNCKASLQFSPVNSEFYTLPGSRQGEAEGKEGLYAQVEFSAQSGRPNRPKENGVFHCFPIFTPRAANFFLIPNRCKNYL